MKKIIKFIKNNLLGFLVALSLCLNGVIIAENMISSEQITYNGTTVKAKVDELVEASDVSDKIGSTDISSIGDGTVSGAINELNSNMVKVDTFDVSAPHTTYDNGVYYCRVNLSNYLSKYNNVLSVMAEMTNPMHGINYHFSYGIINNIQLWVNSTASATSTVKITVLYTD